MKTLLFVAATAPLAASGAAQRGQAWSERKQRDLCTWQAHFRKFASVLAIVTVAGSEARATEYSVTLLQDVGGQPNNSPNAINASGQSAGFASTATGYDAVSWSSTGAGVVLQDVGNDGQSFAFGINSSGQSVGSSSTVTFNSQSGTNAYGQTAALWSPAGTGAVLQDIGGQGISQANAINASGQSAGYSWTASNQQSAALWSSTGSGALLPGVGGQYSQALGINDIGQSVGYSSTAANQQDAVLWSSSGAVTVLQDVGGKGWSQALAINASGQSAGYSQTAAGYDAVVWSSTGAGTVLQDVGGQGWSSAYAINDLGQSVGSSNTATGGDAVLWSSTGMGTDLGNVLGGNWSWTGATGINNQGDIIGYGYDAGVGNVGFLLTPVASGVPEPSTWAMMLVGFAALGVAGYRRNKAAVLAA